jgi:N6-adenosine-specific RNA methylase IME4
MTDPPFAPLPELAGGWRTLGAWPFGALQPHAYDLIDADPPWRFLIRSPRGQRKSPSRHFRDMSLEEIMALPVADLARPDCVLILWTLWTHIPQALAVMAAWGFDFKSGGAWAKRSKTGRSWAFSTGYILRGACEPFLIGTRGRPRFVSRSERNLIVTPVRRHSQKPDEMHEALERLCPRGRRVELFAIEQDRPGWDYWGDGQWFKDRWKAGRPPFDLLAEAPQ